MHEYPVLEPAKIPASCGLRGSGGADVRGNPVGFPAENQHIMSGAFGSLLALMSRTVRLRYPAYLGCICSRAGSRPAAAGRSRFCVIRRLFPELKSRRFPKRHSFFHTPISRAAQPRKRPVTVNQRNHQSRSTPWPIRELWLLGELRFPWFSQRTSLLTVYPQSRCGR